MTDDPTPPLWEPPMACAAGTQYGRSDALLPAPHRCRITPRISLSCLTVRWPVSGSPAPRKGRRHQRLVLEPGARVGVVVDTGATVR